MAELHKRLIKEREGATPLLSLTLWPHRSMDKKTFYNLMIVLSGAMMIPVIPFIGKTGIFLVLPFSSVTLLLLFFFIMLNYRAGRLYESIKIWPDLIEVRRFEVNGIDKNWCSNPYWTKVKLYEKNQKVENYLTLSGGGREVEIGSFLAPSERIEVKNKIENIMRDIT
jgi:uncharacterized membrane protein